MRAFEAYLEAEAFVMGDGFERRDRDVLAIEP